MTLILIVIFLILLNKVTVMLFSKEFLTEASNYPIYSQDDKKLEAVVLCRLTLSVPDVYTAYLLEYDPDNDVFFGLARLHNCIDYLEYGYISKNELESLNDQYGICIDSEVPAFKTTLKECFLKYPEDHLHL